MSNTLRDRDWGAELALLPTPEEAEAAMLAALPRLSKLWNELCAAAADMEEPEGPLLLGTDPDYEEHD